ncbi:MAG: hypothetical protein V4773_27620 [Verrucomicrobiota bacterium]
MKTRKSRKTQPQEMFVAAVVSTESHVVTRDGKVCTLINVSGFHKGGVLQPGSPAVMFDKPRDARRAVVRTIRAREKLRGSLVSQWLLEQLPSFIDGEKFEVVPCGYQREPEPTVPSPAAAAAARPIPTRQMEMEGHG